MKVPGYNDPPYLSAHQLPEHLQLVGVSQDEHRQFHTDPETGARKEVKLARFDLVPARPLWELAEHYGIGAKKYQDHNWRKGYAWSLSYTAALRHLNQFWGGEDVDAETGSLHVIAAAWHCFSLAEFIRCNPDRDDRWKP